MSELLRLLTLATLLLLAVTTATVPAQAAELEKVTFYVA